MKGPVLTIFPRSFSFKMTNFAQVFLLIHPCSASKLKTVAGFNVAVLNASIGYKPDSAN